jgi:ankyrin repeat protein
VAVVGSGLAMFVLLVRVDVLSMLAFANAAATDGEAWKVRLALAIDPRVGDMDQYDDWMWSPLHKAAMRGHAGIAQDLIDGGTDPKHACGPGWTALHEAAWRGSIGVMDVLVHNGATLDAVDDQGMTPLTWAVVAGRRASVRWLVEKGARGDVASPDGMTAVYAATRFSDAAMLKLTLANVKGVDDFAHSGITALHRAAFSGDIDKVRLLLEYGPDVDAGSIGWVPRRWRPVPPEPPDVGDDTIVLEDNSTVIPPPLTWDGATPLHCAAACGSGQIARLLLERGADASARTEDDQAPADWAAGRGYRRLARFLREVEKKRTPVTSSSKTSGGST